MWHRSHIVRELTRQQLPTIEDLKSFANSLPEACQPSDTMATRESTEGGVINHDTDAFDAAFTAWRSKMCIVIVCNLAIRRFGCSLSWRMGLPLWVHMHFAGCCAGDGAVVPAILHISGGSCGRRGPPCGSPAGPLCRRSCRRTALCCSGCPPGAVPQPAHMPFPDTSEIRCIWSRT